MEQPRRLGSALLSPRVENKALEKIPSAGMGAGAPGTQNCDPRGAGPSQTAPLGRGRSPAMAVPAAGSAFFIDSLYRLWHLGQNISSHRNS